MTLRLFPECHPPGIAVAAARYYFCVRAWPSPYIRWLVRNGNLPRAFVDLRCAQLCGLADQPHTPRPCISRDEGSPLQPTERRSRPIAGGGRQPIFGLCQSSESGSRSRRKSPASSRPNSGRHQAYVAGAHAGRQAAVERGQ